MAINAEQLNIILAARDKEFTKAMDRANRRVENFARKSQKDLNKTTQAFSGMKAMAGKLGVALSAGAIVGGFTRLIDNASRTAKELQNLARISGTNVEDFQKLAFASRTVGIEQDKLADILKDVNDKFGDYFATGAGPLKDFFENIAPKVGVTAKAFQGLSSDQALGLYVKTLQDAGVNQQELTFYMEALASDATALSPLLLNNASAMTELGERAQELGIILDQDVIAKSAKLRQKWDEVMGAMSGRLTEFALYALEIFDKIFNLTEEEQLNELGKQIGFAAQNLAEQQKQIKEYQSATYFNSEGERQAAIANATEALKDNVAALQLAEAEYDRFFKQLEARADLRASLESGGLGGSTNVTGGATSGTVIGDVANDAKRATQEIKTMNKAVDELESVAGMVGKSFEDAFMSMVDGTKSAQDAFRDMTRSIIADLYRQYVVKQITGFITQAVGAAIAGPVQGPNLPSSTGEASGGPVQAGRAYTVGEHGRELFVPQTAGRVLSVPQTKDALGGGGQVTVTQNFNFSANGDDSVKQIIAGAMPQIAKATQNAIVDARRRGGSMKQAFG